MNPANNPLESGFTVFPDAEYTIRQSLARESLKSKARQKKQDEEDARLRNANNSAIVRISMVNASNPTQPPPISPINKTPSISDIVKERQRNIRPRYDPQTGKGVMYGRGYNLTETSKKNRHYLCEGKYYVELHKLKENVLSVKYSSTDAHLTTVKIQTITDDVKTLIEDVLKDKYNERLFQQLNANDKRVFKRFVKGVKIDIPINDDLDRQFHKDYQILKGEFESGNDSPEVRKALKKYVLEGLAENRINKHESYFLLYQLSL